MELLNAGFSDDEQLVCISENDACGVDAIQVVLGCSAGKGNLLFRPRGKQAFGFYRRSDGKGVRLVLRPRPEGMSKEESFAWMQARTPAELFEGERAPPARLPEPARLMDQPPVFGVRRDDHGIHAAAGKRPARLPGLLASLYPVRAVR